jgi:hypothetical protein
VLGGVGILEREPGGLQEFFAPTDWMERRPLAVQRCLSGQPPQSERRKLARRSPRRSGSEIRATLPAGQVTVPAARSISNSRLWKREPVREVAGGASTPTSRCSSSSSVSLLP